MSLIFHWILRLTESSTGDYSFFWGVYTAQIYLITAHGPAHGSARPSSRLMAHGSAHGSAAAVHGSARGSAATAQGPGLSRVQGSRPTAQPTSQLISQPTSQQSKTLALKCTWICGDLALSRWEILRRYRIQLADRKLSPSARAFMVTLHSAHQ